MDQLKESLDGYSPLTHAERLQRIEALKVAWDTIEISPMERSQLTKQIVERIEYTRDGNKIDIRVKLR